MSYISLWLLTVICIRPFWRNTKLENSVASDCFGTKPNPQNMKKHEKSQTEKLENSIYLTPQTGKFYFIDILKFLSIVWGDVSLALKGSSGLK